MSMSEFARNVMEHKYSHTFESGELENWDNIAYRVTKNVMKAAGYNMRTKTCRDLHKAISERKFMPGGRYLYASGRPYHQTQNCLLLRAEDSREGWAGLLHKAAMALMTGSGIGIEYSRIREEGARIRRTGGVATGPIALMQMVNECGRGIMQGGSRRSAIWAGLNWQHPDIHKFMTIKDWPDEVKEMKLRDFNFPATLDMTNISIGLDDEFFEAYHDRENPQHSLAHGVYWTAIRHMLRTGEPGFSVNCGEDSGDDLRNACTEVVSADDSDICNLGSINLARVESLEEMERLVELGTKFLLAGTLYSDVPYAEVDRVRNENRRLGLGLMGVHEWLLTHGKTYGPDEELEKYLDIYAKADDYAQQFAERWDISVPIATRAIAPTGTIGIVAETTTGIEPIFCVAYKRRYLKGRVWCYQYVIDPCARRLIDSGVNPGIVEDAYRLAESPERRVAFQAWIQRWVDQSISSTINLPEWGSRLNNDGTEQDFGNMLIKHLPNIRGITVYPDGARGGQPLTPVAYSQAVGQEGIELVEEQIDVCDITKGGSCGS